MNKILKEILISSGIIFMGIYILFTFGTFIYAIDLITDWKPCGIIGEYCSYYKEVNGIKYHCYHSDHYGICDEIGDGIGYD